MSATTLELVGMRARRRCSGRGRAINLHTAQLALATGNTPPPVFAYSALSVPRAEAMAARGGQVLAVGSRDELESLRGAGTEILELGVTWTTP